MKNPRQFFFLCVSIAMIGAFSVRAEDPMDQMDPDVKAALDAAKKAAPATSPGLSPDMKKLMDKAKQDAEKDDSDVTPPPAPATPPKPLKALPDWIPPVTGFKADPGATHWTEEGMEKGKMTGTVPGAPRDVTKQYIDMAKAANKLNTGVNDVTVNNELTMIVFLTSREGDEKNLKLTLKPSPDGKSSLATFEYSQALPSAKPAGN
jgi:hypothetical protein